MAITLIGLNTPRELKAAVQQCCPENEMWSNIVAAEEEMEEFRGKKDNGEPDLIAYEIMSNSIPLGLLQHRYRKGGFLKKEQLVIDLLTLAEFDPEVVGTIHQMLVQECGLSGELIHAITKAEEGTPIHHWLKEAGFSEHRNSNQHPKYGFEPGALYFVKKV